MPAKSIVRGPGILFLRREMPVDLLVQRDLLGHGEFPLSRRSLTAAEVATVVAAPLAETAVGARVLLLLPGHR